MNRKVIDEIVWWIPFKKLRNNIRIYLNNKLDDDPMEAYDIEWVKKFIKSLKEDKNFIKKYKILMKNLDKDSIETISNIIIKVFKIINNIDSYKSIINGEELKSVVKMYNEYLSKIIKINDECYLYEDYVLPVNKFEKCIFYSKLSIEYINNLHNIKNRDIIDAGAFIGDSGIMLSKYTNKNVYCFEPFKNIYDIMLKTIELNNIKNIVPVNLALGNENSKITSFYDPQNAVNGCNSLINNNNDVYTNEEIINMITLDEFVYKNNLEVGLIKTDLEGFEQEFLKGAINTIKKHKPVLPISIYHNYSDFFDIKPMIEDLNLGYKFKIVKPIDNTIILETTLIAEIY
ncbi:FkbM family methyltransferase [Brachyspira hyodysenteriae]|nr:FkbM family methyltransferase [Brachyspira hyodysenteriae]MDA0061855.1 FkbM family methyltransferase [Brachyspira hyodysenteriae]MDA0061861.1 FkbM family methyltransferase [Brachyspira hyodysenteriae]MDA0065622.1 FkbM family methyltransferase [Brachyspira hyodysenteriae]MDA0070715.1 FkbM family methyltransferase [Brachyspira hyodysenteriae]MDA0088592.1 FkbM family methyltransferase [Brachyspira hyodysenteriae]